MADGGPSFRALEILKLLREHQNVLISGPPATGKSRLLNEVAQWFPGTSRPAHDPYGPIPLPAEATAAQLEEWLPSPERSNREVFQTAFHQGTKYRDFMRGLIPVTGEGKTGFVVSSGTLYRASMHSLQDDGAALVIVDEINRGPAVQVFGDSIVALEPDKRLNREGKPTATTQFFEVLADDGLLVRHALPVHLYLLAAMNQADTSVEPLDVAFLRRWEPYRLEPDVAELQQYFDLADPMAAVPEEPTEPSQIYTAAVKAWNAVNERIAIGRGREYMIGHGIFMGADPPPVDDLDGAVDLVARGWRRLKHHVDEVFFGHVRGAAEVYNVGATDHPYSLRETIFADEPMAELVAPHRLTRPELVRLLIAVGAQ